MKLFNSFIRYMNPSIEQKVLKDMDRRSLRSIHIMSLIVLFFESALFVFFGLSRIGHFEHSDIVSMVSVGYCVIFCAGAAILSQKMLRNRDLPHSRFIIFKVFFFILFSVWAIFVDYRHYKVDDQMLTFYTVNLVMICFILFNPWAGALLVSGAYAGLYLSMYSFDRAAGIEFLNFLVLLLASVASNAILYHAQINVSTKAIRLLENNEALENSSRRDGLTGLLNRLALEEDAKRMDGRRMTVYMADINYFKEINDRHGHAAGDAILREVSETLARLFPGGHYYRYGGDEFLVLTYKTPEENYGSDTYDFIYNGEKVLLSIGNAQGEPKDYHELFDLISVADKALYITKKRTHSVEFGGHDRRQGRR